MANKSNSQRLAEFRSKKKEEEKKSSSSSGLSSNSDRLGKIRLENTIGLDTFESDLKNVGTTISGIYNGWQTTETMANTRATVESMQKRINAYQNYQKKYGGTDLSDIASGYQTVLDDWDNLTSLYGQYKNADAFNTAKKRTELDKQFKGLTYDEVQSKKKNYKEDSDEYKYLSEYTGYTDLNDFDRAIEEAKKNGAKKTEYTRAELGRAQKSGTKLEESNTFLDQLETAKNKHKLENGVNDYYEQYMEEKDFEELSQYKQTELEGWWDKLNNGDYGLGYGDVTYEYINNVDGARDKIKQKKRVYGSDSKDTTTSQEKKGYDELTPEEIQMYNYLYAKDRKLAEKYLEEMEVVLSKRVYDKSSSGVDGTSGWKGFADKHPVISSTLSTPMNIMGGFTGAVDTVKDIAQRKEYNPYGYYKAPSNFASDTREVVGENIAENTDWEFLGTNVPSFLYQTAMSISDTAVGGAMLGTGYSAIAGSSAFQQKAKELTEEGASQGQVLTGAFLSGGAEMLFEHISLDKLLKIKGVDGWRKGFKETFKQAGIEASEELATEFANLWSDQVVRGNASELKQMYDDFIARGYTTEEAEKEIRKVVYRRLGEAAMGGFLSGGALGSVQSVRSYNQNKNIGSQIKANERTEDFLGNMTEDESEAYKLYTEYANKGINAENIEDVQLGNIYTTMYGEAKETLDNKKATKEERANAKKKLDSLEYVIGERTEKEKALKKEQTEAKSRATEMNIGAESVVSETGDAISVKGIKSTEDGTVIVTDNGEVALTETTLTGNDAMLVAYAENMGETKGSMFISNYDKQMDVHQYFKDFTEVYDKSANGFSQDIVLRNKGTLNETQVGEIYKSTILTANKERQAFIDNLNAKSSKNFITEGKFNDSVIDYDSKTTDGSKVNWNSLNQRQREAITFMQGVSKALGINIVLEKEGKQKRYNGWYSASENAIHIDVYAGMESMNDSDTIIPVFSHELTHWMKQKTPQMYQKMMDYALETIDIASHGSVEAYVEAERKRLDDRHAKKDGSLHESSEAMDEILARACEDMLTNSKSVKEFMNRLTETEQKSFIDKVKKMFKDILTWVDDMLSQYKGQRATSEEAKLLRRYKDRFEEMSAMWDKALEEAVKTNQSMRGKGVKDEFKDVKSNLEAQFSMRYWDKMKNEQDDLLYKILSGQTGYEFDTDMDAKSLDKAQKLVTDTIREINNRKMKNDMMIFPTEVLGRVMSKNLSYGVSIDGTRICFRTVTFNHFNDMVQEIVGRPLNANEQLVVNEKLVVIAKEPQCLVCYVALDRKAYWEDVLWYMDVRDKYIGLWNKTNKTEEDFQKLYKKFLREKVDSIADKYRRKLENAEENGVAYSGILDQFLNEPLKGDDLKHQKKLKKAWDSSTKTEDEAKQILSGYTNAWHPAPKKKPTAEMETRLRSWFSWADSGVPLLKRSDLTTEDKLADLFNQTVKKGRESIKKNIGETYADGDIATQYFDLNKYAQSASWAKKADMSEDVLSEDEETFGKPIDQSLAKYQTVLTYWNDIRKLKPSDVFRLNHEYGLRFYSYSEFNAAFLVDNMQEFIDASLVGLKALMYSKSYEGARFFAPSGANINVGVIIEEDGQGGYRVSKEQSTPTSLSNLTRLREQYPNVGIIAVATTKDMAIWAAKQPWTDVVIPFHTVRNSYGVSEMGWQDHKAEQEDKKPGKKNPAAQELWKAFVQETQSKEMGTKEPSASIMPFEHENDYATYRELCAKRGVTPRFTSYLPENSGLTEQEYMKFVVETRRKASETPIVKPVFQESVITEILDEFEKGGGYRAQYTIPDSEIESHAQEVAKDILRGKTAMDVEYGSEQSKRIARMKMSGEINADNVPRVHGQSMIRQYSDRDYAPTFYSHMGKVVDGIKQNKLGADSVVNYLKGKGVKDEEIKWSGIETFLEGKKSVTKADLQEFVAGSMLHIEEETLNQEGLKKLEKLLLKQGITLEDYTTPFADGVDYGAIRETLDEYNYYGDIDEYSYMEIIDALDNIGNISNWSQYTIEGGDNYRVFLFKMPGLDYMNRAMNAHWGQGGVLAHARLQDVQTEDGKKMLFIEEIQSDWHNEGQKVGYKDGSELALQEEVDELFRKRRSVRNKRDELQEKVLDVENRIAEKVEFYPRWVIFAALSNQDVEYDITYEVAEFIRGMATEEEMSVFKQYAESDNKIKEISAKIDKLESRIYDVPPDAPFRTNYHEYVLKRLLRMASEEGYDSIGWTTAEIQAERWSDEYMEGYRIEYDQDIPKFLRKYGKKWGATVGHTTTTSGYDVWSMDIPQSMKDSVLYEGQVMYSDRDNGPYRILDEEYRLEEENKALREDIKALKYILQIERDKNFKNSLDESKLKSAAKYLLNKVDSKYDRTEFEDGMREIFLYIGDAKQLDANIVMSKCNELARRVMAKSNSFQGKNAYIEKVLKDLNKVDVANIENEWQGLSEKYPKLFPKDTKVEDMATEFNDTLNTVQATSDMYKSFNKDQARISLATEIYNQYWNVATTDLKDKEIQRLRLDHRKQMDFIRDKHKERMQNQRLADAMHYGKVIEKVKQKDKEKLKKVREADANRQKAQNLKADITRKALTLNRWLKNNSHKEHIPEGLQPIVAKFLNALDFSSKRYIDTGGQDYTKSDMYFAEALRQVHEMMRESNDGAIGVEGAKYYGLQFSEGDIKTIGQLVKSVNEMVSNGRLYVLNQLTVEELQVLDDMVSMLKKGIEDVNKFHTIKHNEGIANMGQNAMVEMNALGQIQEHDGARGWFEKMMNFKNKTPFYAFKMFGKWGLKTFEAFQDGWDKFAFNVKRVIEFTKGLYTSKEVRAWKDEVKTFSHRGKSVKITTPQLMALYCLSKRTQALKHILKGGVHIADFTQKGKVVAQNFTVHFTEAELNNLFKRELTARQIEVADKMQEFMNTVCAEWGNEVTMELYGINQFGKEDFYFPIKSDPENLNKDEKQVAQENPFFRLLNMSFTKPLEDDAENRIMVLDIFEVFSAHASDMAKYNALALPVIDTYKLLNYKEKVPTSAIEHDVHSLKRSLNKAFGKSASSYIYTFLKDLNGAENTSRDSAGSKFMSYGKIAAVGGNLRVALLQPTAYFKAGLVMNPKYLANALGHKKSTLKRNYERALKYCGMVTWKSMGFYDTSISRGLLSQITHDESFRDKAVEVAMMGTANGDMMTLAYLWTACESEIRNTRPNLKVDTEEFYQAIGNRLREVIYATQVVDSTVTRSEMMRGSGMYDKMLTAFASEPTLSLNMLQDAFVQYKLTERRQGKEVAKKKHKKDIRRAMSVYAITGLATSIVGTLIDILRDTEDEKEAEDIWKAFFDNLNSDLSILGKIPYLKELKNAFEGFSSSRMDTQWMEQFVAVYRDIQKFIEGDGNAFKTVKDILKVSGSLVGFPFYNVYRDLLAIGDWFGLEAEDLEEMMDDIG